MYSIEEVAMYIINYSIEIGRPVSNVKLQKLLFLAQIKSINDKMEFLFKGDFVKWRQGAVNVDIYEKYGMFLGTTIDVWQDKIIEHIYGDDFSYQKKVIEFQMSDIKQEDRELIEYVVDNNINKSGWDLVYELNELEVVKNTRKDEVIALG